MLTTTLQAIGLFMATNIDDITVPAIDDLRPMRQAKNITLTSAAQHFGVWPARISTLERGTRRDDDLANAYRAWLTAA